MSGSSGSTTCPNCGNTDADMYIDRKPFDYISINCLECGLHIYPEVEYYTLEELNASREEYDLEPLVKLPEQNKDL